MRPIHLVSLDKVRPAVILTRAEVRPYRAQITIAPITTTVRGLVSEVEVGPANGLGHKSVANVDMIQTIPAGAIGRLVGHLTAAQELALARAISDAFDLAALDE
jgi:mRNA interferase MazF